MGFVVNLFSCVSSIAGNKPKQKSWSYLGKMLEGFEVQVF